MACLVNICQILLGEQLFSEDQDFWDGPDRGVFVIVWIIAATKEFLLRAKTHIRILLVCYC